ncbi:unnamed protein product [Owenia fusiformis]|uniref:Uncharacterized protein n=1 Tax=Owenia fusiformis TaxID=6347 RepID=A0A8J1XU66_OWEFU|nr:unnamed protein product [Owenia fusiformis]
MMRVNYMEKGVVLWLYIVGAVSGMGLHGSKRETRSDDSMIVNKLEVKMPGIVPPSDDYYVCTSVPVPYTDEEYVVKFEAQATGDIAHHMLLFGCVDGPASDEEHWECGQTCKGGSNIMFAWAKNAEPKELPKDVGFKIGGPNGVKHLVLQVHYAAKFKDGQAGDHSGLTLSVTPQRQKYIAGIFVLWSGSFSVPGNTPVHHVDISCKFDGSQDIHPFAFRPHAHTLGQVITGYKVEPATGEWEMLGKGNPQWPQAFYPMDDVKTIHPGDEVVGRCTFNSTGRDRPTFVGATHNDEMCNFYMMYYTDAEKGSAFYSCGENNLPDLVKKIPDGNDTPLPPNPLLDEQATGHHHHGGMAGEKDNGVDATENDKNIKKLDILMPGIVPPMDDYYVCTSIPVPYTDEEYVVKFEAQATGDIAHHMLLFGCDAPASSQEHWECGNTCKGESKIMFAWARNAAPKELPKDVGFRIGGSSGVKHLVLQVHYASKFKGNKDSSAEGRAGDRSGFTLSVTPQRQKYLAGIYLLLAYMFSVPGNTPVYHVDMSCRFKGTQDIHPFAFRPHAHTLGRVISGYKIDPKTREWDMLGKGNPQWPQAFYPMDGVKTIHPGDDVVGRCTFNSTGRSRATNVGATHNDEMCNFYMMYYTDAEKGSAFFECFGNNLPDLVKQIPDGNDTPLPPNPLLDEQATGHHHHGGMAGEKDNEVDAIPKPTKTVTNLDIELVNEWPILTEQDNVFLGQVSAVATDSKSNVYVFHRGHHVWNPTAFDVENRYTRISEGPIKEAAILVFNPEGKLIKKWGEDTFYMPHGITIDKDDNVWVTDVAMHQVMKFDAGKTDIPSILLGEKFNPNSHNGLHFCKPTDVAVLSSGEFYVADGYCHHRVLKFAADGKVLKEWGEITPELIKNGFPPPYHFSIPHSLSVKENSDGTGELFVADRENGRIQVFDLNGNFTRQIHPDEFGGRVYALEYCPHNGGILFAVNGPNYFGTTNPQGLTIKPKDGSLINTWTPRDEGFHKPHDITISNAGDALYVAEIGPNKVWKFKVTTITKKVIEEPNVNVETNEEATSVKKGGVEHLMNPDNKGGEDNQKPNSGVLLNEISHISESVATEDDSSEPEGPPSFDASLIIGALLIVPILVIMVVVLIIRLKNSGKLSCLSGYTKNRREVFSFGGLIRSHKGFERLSAEDQELEHLSDSDIDEYSATIQKA